MRRCIAESITYEILPSLRRLNHQVQQSIMLCRSRAENERASHAAWWHETRLLAA